MPRNQFGELTSNGEASDFLLRAETKGDTAECCLSHLGGTEDLLDEKDGEG